MALCILGSRFAFSKNYNNYHFKGYDADTLIERVSELLSEKLPHIVWLPHTSEVAVEHTSLKAARAENPIEEVEDCIKGCWAQAVREQEEDMSEEELAHTRALKSASNFNEVLRLCEEFGMD